MSKIQFISWDSTGEIAVAVDGKTIIYKGDAAWIPEWQRKARRSPNKVYAEVKRYCTQLN